MKVFLHNDFNWKKKRRLQFLIGTDRRSETLRISN